MSAVATGQHAATDYCRDLLSRLPPAEIDPPPLITGNDLIAAGFSPGPKFKDWLERIRDEQLDGTINSRESALTHLAEWVNNEASG
jgi:hypothetical protein